MRVLITGATGLIGKALVEKFFSAGIKVNFLTTKKSKIHSIKEATGFYWSPTRKILDLKCFDGVDSIIHLAGILNIKSILLLNLNSDWRWFLDTEQTVWYPSVKIIKQKKLNDWDNVFEELQKILEDKKKRQKV